MSGGKHGIYSYVHDITFQSLQLPLMLAPQQLQMMEKGDGMDGDGDEPATKRVRTMQHHNT